MAERRRRRGPPADCSSAFASFFLAHARPVLAALLWRADDAAHHGLPADSLALLAAAPALAHAALDEPLATLQHADAGARSAQATLLAAGGAGPRPPGREQEVADAPCVKPLVHARFDFQRLALAVPGACALDAGGLRERHVGRLVAVTARVARAGQPRLRQAARAVECAACRHAFALPLDAETGASAPLPAACPAGSAARCSAARFNPVPPPGGPGAPPPPALCVDAAEALLCPSRDALRGGGGGCCCVMEADLAGGATPGDTVLVAGVVRRRWRAAARPGSRAAAELVLHATSLAPRRPEADAAANAPPPLPRLPAADPLAEWAPYWRAHAARPLAARDALVAALCPSLHGLAAAKLALTLALAGGVPGRGAGGQRVRGEAHVLLCGDAGTGKSTLLRGAARLARRSALASGAACTAAGLAAAAVRDGAGWALEAGALVRAHGGVAAVDDLGALAVAQRDALHEALEAQRVTCAKAGVRASLPCACSLLAACDAAPGAAAAADLELRTGLAAPLLSRFDLVLCLTDCPPGGRGGPLDAARADAVLGLAPTANVAAPSVAPWNAAAAARYLAAVRDALVPQLAPEAQRMAAAYYQMQRRSAGRAAARTTPRLLESIVRLTQAHARVMMRPVAGADDAAQAIALLRAADAAAGTPPPPGAFPPVSLSADFSDDPDGVAAAAQASLFAELDAALGPAWRHDADAPQPLRIEAGPTRWEEEEEAEEDEHAPDNSGARFEEWEDWDTAEPDAKRMRDNEDE